MLGAYDLATISDPSWYLAGTKPAFVLADGDFDGDGWADVFWRNDGTGQNLVWRMKGGEVLESVNLAPASPDWRYVGSADFDRDNNLDI
ncbi:MAG TPA: VCBS repeat-containing protein, partial [Ramlibacter sp.]|nr:VCBS repeat-containing protein [Ramlibacter sp.]